MSGTPVPPDPSIERTSLSAVRRAQHVRNTVGRVVEPGDVGIGRVDGDAADPSVPGREDLPARRGVATHWWCARRSRCRTRDTQRPGSKARPRSPRSSGPQEIRPGELPRRRTVDGPPGAGSARPEDVGIGRVHGERRDEEAVRIRDARHRLCEGRAAVQRRRNSGNPWNSMNSRCGSTGSIATYPPSPP